MTDRDEPFRIEISREVADAAGMPDDLDAAAVGPYAVPDVSRRRRAAVVYFCAAAAVAVLVMADLPAGMWWLVAALVILGVYHVAAGWRLDVREGQALAVASRVSEFPVGHVAAALSFTGPLAKPVWNVLVFSADDPPTRQGLIRIRATTGEVVDSYVREVESGSSG